MRLKRVGHVLLRVADFERSKAFYTDVLGFQVVEEDPKLREAFLSLGDDFHNLDVMQHPNPSAVQHPRREQVGLVHIAFQVESYAALREAYLGLQEHGIEINHASDHVNQRSIYFQDPDGNGLEIYYERPDAFQLYSGNRRGDMDEELPISRPGEPVPGWLLEDWPRPGVAATATATG